MRRCIFSAYSKEDAEILTAQTSDIWDITVTFDSSTIFTLLINGGYEFLLFDVESGGMFPLDILQKVKNDFPSVDIFVIVHGAYDILKHKFSEYLISGIFEFPKDFAHIKTAIEDFFDTKQARTDTISFIDEKTSILLNSEIIGQSYAMNELREFISKAAILDFPVLLTGETGCGKGLAAKLIHNLNTSKTGKFIPVNVGCIPETLAESLLFGTEKGSFTGAETKDGVFSAADGGTIFLDEMETLPLSIQTKLLYVLESKEIYRVGSTQPKKIDFRLICAANEDLKVLVEKKLFRQDLYYRLDVLRHEIPPLRKRKEDIAPLVFSYLNKTGKQISPAAMQKLYINRWAGNIRELENCIKRACCKAIHSNIIEAVHIEF